MAGNLPRSNQRAFGLTNTPERPQQERLHTLLGGTMILEFRAVDRSATRERRDIDSVILPNVPYLTIDGEHYDIAVWADLDWSQREKVLAMMRAEPVICVQAKNSRLGPYLLGQALFSPGLLRAKGITVERSIALCGGDEPTLSAVAQEDFGLDVIVDPLVPNRVERKGLLRPNASALRAYWQATGGTLYPQYQILNPGRRGATRVDGVIVSGGPSQEHAEGTWVDLRDRDVTIVTTTLARACMYSLGMAVFSRCLAERAGARAKAVLIARDHDSALGPLIEQYPNVEVVASHEIDGLVT